MGDRLYLALEKLVALKDEKDMYGKTENYEKRKSVA